MALGGEILRAAAGGVRERYFTGVLVLRLTGDGDAVLETTGDTCNCGVRVVADQGDVFARETPLGTSSAHEQIEPSSPNLYETSLGSIHKVSWVGKYSEMLVSPVTLAASFTTGSSRHPLILIQRYALP